MNLKEFEIEFSKLGNNYKTKDIDKLNKTLIKNKKDVSCLKNIILNKQEYHRTYFQVSLSKLNTIEEQLNFIENNFELLQDWWHVDQLPQFLKKIPNELAYEKAKEYINNEMPFARRWGYVLWMPTLVKDKNNFENIKKLFKDDNEYYVQMVEAWLISYMAIYHTEETLEYLKTKPLNYEITGKAIQKILDSFRIKKEDKEKFKKIRNLYK